ncbi:Na(+)/H(+) antiporter NhaA [Actinoplanes sp. OR16]|uniref:Na+/H+ antiporter NhaA n=1 Tax=Actinoplanes sp. OR16 TaxID=946334 RepID=UPI000F6EB8EA|nr:Na+/H+ antiporter NhaA [Actinoplanes sp. OR16]BBH68904.1 Na(+)/H(+) antiporter NhaA [Actinoplanes sp. OR16]
MPNRLFSLGSWAEARRVADILRAETVGGLLLLGATVLALIWANSPWKDFYQDLAAFQLIPDEWPLHLSLSAWAADGLLAIFFFVAGLELKREFVAGDLRDPRRAALPVLAAVGGMIVPAVIYLAVIRAGGGGGAIGWAVPTATDIAFALAVLGVISTHLPAALRTFLLTLAVVDDLLAILIIATVYTASVHPIPLVLAFLVVAVFGVLVQRGITRWWLLLPLALVAWTLVHESGVHATVAGVLLAFTVPVLPRNGDDHGLAERLEHRWRPISAGFAVPVFAFFAAGVTLGGGEGLGAAVTLAAVLGLVAGKPIGILGATWLVQRFTKARLAEGLSWWDVLGLGLLGGIGFTVSLLVSELAYGPGTVFDEQAKIGVLAGSLLAAVLAAVLLRLRNRHFRRLHEEETRDDDADGIPDAYQR